MSQRSTSRTGLRADYLQKLYGDAEARRVAGGINDLLQRYGKWRHVSAEGISGMSC